MDILKYENLFKSQGYKKIIGIDEAGRGPLAGPVVAASVNWGDAPLIEGIKDSKKISEKKRLILFDLIIENAVDIGVGIVHENKIDKINVLQATYLAMRISIGNLKNKPDLLLVDGNRADIQHIKQKNIIKGDTLSYSIACASIIAKVTRDKIMHQYDKIFPEYGFSRHKGYGTTFHLDILYKHKSCPIHRKSFKPVKMHLPTFQHYRDTNKLDVLSKQLVALKMIKNRNKILFFNDKYDLVYKKGDLIIIQNIISTVDGKTINSKNSSKKLNFNDEMHSFLVENKLKFKKLRLDKGYIDLSKKGNNISVKKGEVIVLS